MSLSNLTAKRGTVNQARMPLQWRENEAIPLVVRREARNNIFFLQ